MNSQFDVGAQRSQEELPGTASRIPESLTASGLRSGRNRYCQPIGENGVHLFLGEPHSSFFYCGRSLGSDSLSRNRSEAGSAICPGLYHNAEMFMSHSTNGADFCEPQAAPQQHDCILQIRFCAPGQIRIRKVVTRSRARMTFKYPSPNNPWCK